mgnify:FL=1
MEYLLLLTNMCFQLIEESLHLQFSSLALGGLLLELANLLLEKLYVEFLTDTSLPSRLPIFQQFVVI